jgi:hypothetical protein
VASSLDTSDTCGRLRMCVDIWMICAGLINVLVDCWLRRDVQGVERSLWDFVRQSLNFLLSPSPAQQRAVLSDWTTSPYHDTGNALASQLHAKKLVGLTSGVVFMSHHQIGCTIRRFIYVIVRVQSHERSSSPESASELPNPCSNQHP